MIRRRLGDKVIAFLLYIDQAVVGGRLSAAERRPDQDMNATVLFKQIRLSNFVIILKSPLRIIFQAWWWDDF